MPNHIKTILQANDEVLESIISEGDVDFNLIIPEPANLEQGSCSGEHEPGVICWFDWRPENWGTKWNAYSTKVSDGEISFETAWAHPLPIMIRLSELNPEKELLVAWANEDTGYDQGLYKIKNGKLIEAAAIGNDGSAFAKEFSSFIRHGVGYSEAYGFYEEDIDDYENDEMSDEESFKSSLSIFDPENKLTDIDEVLTIDNYPKVSKEALMTDYKRFSKTVDLDLFMADYQ